MKRPSNLVLGFILLIPSIFVFYAISRITLNLFKAPEIEESSRLKTNLSSKSDRIELDSYYSDRS